MPASFKQFFTGRDGALEQIVAKLLHLRASQLCADVLRPARIRSDKRQINVVLLRAGESDLRFFGFLLDALERVGLLAQIHAALLFEFVEDPIHDAIVPVITAEVSITVCRFDFEDAVADFQNRNVERATAEVVNRDLLVLFLVETVCQEAAVGSLIMRNTSRPAILPASLVAWRCESLK